MKAKIKTKLQKKNFPEFSCKAENEKVFVKNLYLQENNENRNDRRKSSCQEQVKNRTCSPQTEPVLHINCSTCSSSMHQTRRWTCMFLETFVCPPPPASSGTFFFSGWGDNLWSSFCFTSHVHHGSILSRDVQHAFIYTETEFTSPPCYF